MGKGMMPEEFDKLNNHGIFKVNICNGHLLT